MKKSIFSLILLFIGGLFLSGQSDYLISMNGDTVFGQIKFFAHSNKIVFKKGSAKATFFPETISQFSVYKKQTNSFDSYKTIRINKEEEVFLKVLANGAIELYEAIEHDTSNLLELKVKKSYYLGRTDKSLHLLVPEYYEPVLYHYLKDNPAIVAKIKGVTFYDIPDLIKTYNKTATKIKFTLPRS